MSEINKEQQIADALNALHQVKQFAINRTDDGLDFSWKIQHQRQLRTYGMKLDRKCIEAAWWIMSLESIAKSMRKVAGLEGKELWPTNEVDELTSLPKYAVSDNSDDKPYDMIELTEDDLDFTGKI